jgi:hypothetical protein
MTETDFQDDLGLDLGEDEVQDPPPLGGRDPLDPDGPDPGPDDDQDEFTEDDYTRADEIRKFSVFARITEIYIRSTGRDRKSFPSQFSNWQASDVVRWSTISTALNSKRVIGGPLGLTVVCDDPALLNAEIVAIKASLVTRKVKPRVDVTDRTLLSVVFEQQGVTVSDEVDSALVRTPGFPDLRVSLVDYKFGRIIDGGDLFVRLFNQQYKTSYSYVETTVTAREHAMIWLAHRKFGERTPTSITFQEIPFDPNNAMRQAYQTRKGAAIRYFNAMRRTLEAVYSDLELRPSVGERTNPQCWLEIAFTRGYARAGPTALENHQRMHKDLLDGLLSKYTELSPEVVLGLTPKEQVRRVASRKLRVPGFPRPLLTYGDVSSFVKRSRLDIRDVADMSRKSDCPGPGPLGSAVSVAVKVRSAIVSLNALRGRDDDARFPHVDAWGTDSKNWWHLTVARVSDNLEFFDLSGSHAPKLGGKFLSANIEHIAPGSKSGKFVFDDTYNATEKNPDHVSNTSKVRSVIESGYEGGFLKLYLGGMDGADGAIGDVVPDLQRLCEAFHGVSLSAESPHSQEYYVAFYGRKADEDGYSWSPPLYDPDKFGTGLGGYARPNRVSKGPLPPGPTIETYLKTWLARKARDMVAGNMRLNVQVMGCCPLPGRFAPFVSSYDKTTFHLSGSASASSQLMGALLVDASNDPDLGLDLE